MLAGLFVALATGLALHGLLGTGHDVLPGLSRPRQVTTAVGVEAYPTWSPDGSRLAYTALSSGDDWDIWVSQITGGPPVNLTSGHPGADMHPSWSPDGGQIAFASDREGGGCFVLPALGGPVRKVTGFSVPPERIHPTWSGDGHELACMAGDSTMRITNLASAEFRDLELPELPVVFST
ncbi:MAG TPA: hypothetical protein VLK65_03905 [Vicinamibacteria bacterium]|nr:hypothetical protein [Vicinamibacteria bacterium]